MLRLVILLILIAAAATAAAWFADNPGRVAVDWLGYRAETSVATLAMAVLALFFAGMALQRLVTLLRRDFPLSKEKRSRRAERRGYAALNRAMAALAAGDGKQARKLTRKAEALLPPQPLIQVIAAETAKLTEDRQAAITHYKALAEDGEAAFLGLRGLVGEAQAAGRIDEARRLARKAVAERPKSHWALEALFGLEIRAGAWQDALETLKKAERAGLFDRDTARRYRAALLYCRAVEMDLAGRSTEAGRLVRDALKRRPGFVPGALLAARLDTAAGKTKRADKTLKAAWRESPHPALLSAYEALTENEPAHARLQRVQALVADRRAHLESRLAEAEAALGADRQDIAREALSGMEESGDARAYRLLTRLAEAQEDTDRAVYWRERASESTAAPSWVCSGCGAHREKWTPLCPSCGRFDSFDWQSVRFPGGPAAVPSSPGLALLDAEPTFRAADEAGGDPPGEPSSRAP